MAGQLIGLCAADVAALMPEIEAFAEIGDYIDQPVRIYSSGMQVRLAFSVATAVRPGILIVDEALAVGDVFFQQKCFERIRAFCAAGTTLLFVSHSMGAVYSLCDRAILLNCGRIALDGSPREVIDLYNAHVLQQRENGTAKVDIVESASAGAANVGSAGDDDANAALHATSELKSPAIGSFGSSGATICAVDLRDGTGSINTVVSEAEVTVRVEVQFTEDYRDPHIGFQIRNARGEAVFMTNTYCMRRTVGAVKRNEKICAEFSFKAGLSAGEYTITAGTSEGGVGESEFNQTLARLQDAKAFTVLRNMDAIVWAGAYNLNPSCKLHRFPG
jgi:lipopolysaccharide transport system ATP-binding protein